MKPLEFKSQMGDSSMEKMKPYHIEKKLSDKAICLHTDDIKARCSILKMDKLQRYFKIERQNTLETECFEKIINHLSIFVALALL